MPNYHIGRLTMDCILAERFQKFVHIENFVNSVYKAFKFVISTFGEDDVLPVYHDVFGSKLNLNAFSGVETNVPRKGVYHLAKNCEFYLKVTAKDTKLK